MKTSYQPIRIWAVALAAVIGLSGCVVHDHHRHGGKRIKIESSHVCSDGCDHYHHHGHWYHAPRHAHGPGCGHVLRGGIWVTIP